MAVDASIINAWLAEHPGSTDAQIYQAMTQAGVSPQDLANATGWDLGQVTSRYNVQAGGATSRDQTPTTAPATNPLLTPPARGALGGSLAGLLSGVSGGSSGGSATYHTPTWNAPTLNTSYTQSPYVQAMIDSMGQQTQDALGKAMQGIQGNAIGIGGLGGSRQGIAQGTAAGQAAAALQANTANLLNTDYNNALNRQLQQYNSELGSATSRYGSDTGAAASMYGADKGAAASMANARLAANAAMYGANLNYGLGQDKLGLDQYQGDQQFYNAQRGLDQNGVMIGANIYNMGNNGYLSQGQGLQNLGTTQQTAPWTNLNNYNNVLGSYSGFGQTSTSGTSGGGLNGVVGGALAGGQIANNLGLTGSTSSMPMINGGGFSNFPAYMLQPAT